MTHGYGGSTVVIGEDVPTEPPDAEVRSARWKPSSGMTVQFWGVRGSIACPEPELARYGGNTACVEVRCGDRLLIFDAGTGLRPLGRMLAESGRATDAEHRPGGLDNNVLQLARDADLMIYDCNYTEEEYPAHVGWGHSTWQQGVRLASAAGAKLLAMFHHDPEHADELLDRIGRAAKAQRAETVVAAEGMTLRFK